MAQFLEVGLSLIDLVVSQLLPTLFLLVGAACQFLFNSVLSFCNPNRRFSLSSAQDIFHSAEVYDGVEYDADDGYLQYEENGHSGPRPLDDDNATRWQTTQSWGGSERQRLVGSPSRGDVRSLQTFGEGDDSDNRTMRSREMSPSRRTARLVDDEKRWNHIDAVGDLTPSLTEQMQRTSSRYLARNPRRSYTPHRPTRFSQDRYRQYASAHSPARQFRSSASPWFALTRSIKKYASKISAFLLYRVWRMPEHPRRRYNRHPSLLQHAW
ncbi:hypothetical protein KP509_05G030300 [Ceratopteris richardii]|uniref:Uncharacterized protein n=1 Tax=Ceratopteris richardii TaxID=49495 RepID=A0A8T2UKI6_CERRI|nr:hypothetical protein KP509_05G030300 [Ceratopteris richardii]